jgi:aldehyde dehydrogenase (NAD+)
VAVVPEMEIPVHLTGSVLLCFWPRACSQLARCLSPKSVYTSQFEGKCQILRNTPQFLDFLKANSSHQSSSKIILCIQILSTISTMASETSSQLESRAYINGQFVSSLTEPPNIIQVHSPSTGSLIGLVEEASSLDVDSAVSAATTAFKGPWGTFTGAQRSKCLSNFADLWEKVAPQVAEIESSSMGAPIIVEATRFIPNAIKIFRYYAAQAYNALQGESWPVDDDEGSYRIVQHQPFGPCALIAAWNATLTFFAYKIAPALATGNTVIFKASEKSPLSVLLLAPLFKEAGFPDGVVNIVSGGASTGNFLARHMGIRLISFTGSALAGKKVMEAAAQTNLKKVTLELGGKSPAVVFADADLEKSIPFIAQSVLGLSGQICIAASRVLVHEDIYENVVKGLKGVFEKASKMAGDPLKKETMLGPLVDEGQFKRVMGLIESGKGEAELATGGQRTGDASFFVQPTLFLKPGKDARIYREEIFGPVMMINTFKTEEEAIEMANDTDYGLFASIWTKDVAKALKVAGKIEAGTITINKAFGFDANTAFGGWKGSGVGREGGLYGLKEFLHEKTIKIAMT